MWATHQRTDGRLIPLMRTVMRHRWNSTSHYRFTIGIYLPILRGQRPTQLANYIESLRPVTIAEQFDPPRWLKHWGLMMGRLISKALACDLH